MTDAIFSEIYILYYERSVKYMRKYILKCAKTGKEWKEFTSGADFLEDEKFYRIEWKLDSFINYLRAWWGIKRKHHHTFTRES